MPRIFFVVVLVVLAHLPAALLALGLGEINSRSALNQPFLAEIPIIVGSGDDLSQLRVNLASRDTFERYGLIQPNFMTGFEFRVMGAPNRPVVRVSSQVPVTEPFVTMLLEVSWPQGRLLREYTVLLDPPVFESAVPAASSPSTAAPAPRPVEQPVVRPQPAPAPVPAPAPRPAPVATGGSYGPVARNDTLWGIAQRVRPDASVDMNQMMLAIYRANPEAFGGNINNLRAGAILRVPSSDELYGIGRGEALSEVRRQNESWQGSSAAAAPRLRLVPPGEDTEQSADGLAGSSGSSLADRAAIESLEAEIAERDRLLEIKNQELEELQQQLAAVEDEALAGAEPDAAEAAGDVGSQAEMEAPVDDTLIGGEPVESAPEEEEPSALIDEVAPQEGIDSEVEPGIEADGEAQMDSGPAEVTEPPPVTTVSRPDEPSFIGQLLGNFWFWLASAAALIAVLIFARSRRKDEPTGRWESLVDSDDIDSESREATDRLRTSASGPEESFVVEEIPPSGGEEDEVGGLVSAAGSDDGGDAELPLERTLSSDTALNLDQSDPIAEAEFHMAYGLYDQAADLLTGALDAQPERRELRRKLLDVYFVWENKGGFTKEAQVFLDHVGADDPEWGKIIIMGKQLCPDDELFAASAAPVTGDDDLDLSLFDAGAADDGDVDLQLGDAPDDVDVDLSGIKDVSDEDLLDFDLGDAKVEDADDSPTRNQDDSDTPTQETPTIEAEGTGGATVETPTIERPGSASTMETPTIEVPGPASTMETPTIESPGPASTMETPTIESPVSGFGEEQVATSDTASLELDELGLDMSAFEDESSNEDVPAISDDDATLLAQDLDDDNLLSDFEPGLDPTAEVPSLGLGEEAGDGLDDLIDADSTAEMKTVEGPGPEFDALLSGDDGDQVGGDTLEQPEVAESTAEQPALDADDAGELADEQAPTTTMGILEGRPEGPTMTEVGTKLDLARAYIDMGDPDGARSILGEVIEEGDGAQRQEAQQLIDDIGS